MTTPTEASHRDHEPRARRPPRGGHRRERLLRARHGDPSAPGGRGQLPDLRAPRRRRRHLAGQLLPRLRLRRPEPPLLVLVRPEPGLEPLLLGPAGDPRLPAARVGRVRHRPLHPQPPRGARRVVGRRRAALGGDDEPGRLDRGRAGAGLGRAVRPVVPRRPGPRGLRGPGVPLRDLAPRPRPARPSRRRHRHRRVRDPVRAGDRPRRRHAEGLPAHAAVDHAARRPRHHRRREAAVPVVPAGPAGRARGHLLGARDVRLRVQGPEAHGEGREDRRAPHAAAGHRPRAAREDHADLLDGLQAHPAVQRLPARARPGQRRGGHREDRRGAAERRRHRRRGLRTRSTRSSPAPGSPSATCRSATASTGATAAASPRSGRARRSPTTAP